MPVRVVTHGFHRLCDSDRLSHAADLTIRRKRRRPDVAQFLFRREDVLAALTVSLASGAWHPEGFRVRFLRDPKPRPIACATIADRIVHTALVEIIGPVFTRSLRPENFACRPGLGAHRALLRLQHALRRNRFCLHLDLKSYFASVDLDVLRALIVQRVQDRPLLDVIDRILADGRTLYDRPEVRTFGGLASDWPGPRCGLPIGALTSQLFAAHVYLDAFDHFVTRELKVPGYTRYVDDMILFSDRRSQLTAWRLAVTDWLDDKRRLRLKHPYARVLCCAHHLDALGHRIRRDRIECLPRGRRRLRARVVAEMAKPARRSLSPHTPQALKSMVEHLLFPRAAL